MRDVNEFKQPCSIYYRPDFSFFLFFWTSNNLKWCGPIKTCHVAKIGIDRITPEHVRPNRHGQYLPSVRTCQHPDQNQPNAHALRDQRHKSQSRWCPVESNYCRAVVSTMQVASWPVTSALLTRTRTPTPQAPPITLVRSTVARYRLLAKL